MGGDERGGEEGEGRGEEAFLVMWPRRLSALNPPLQVIDYIHFFRASAAYHACFTITVRLFDCLFVTLRYCI